MQSIKKDQIARLPLARLTVGDVERWHTRLRKAGMADAGIKNQHGVLRAALVAGGAMGMGVVERGLARPAAVDEDAAAHA